MARIVGLSDAPKPVAAALAGILRGSDEATLLPAASRSPESGSFKNVVLRLAGADPQIDPELFSSDWFGGASALSIPAAEAESLLLDSAKRAAALEALAEAIPSEHFDPDLTVGPSLDCDGQDRDAKSWVAGFDSGSCSVGLYSARQARSPAGATVRGMSRAHTAYYLVCKAGGGVAAQTFHTRLCAALRAGKTLDQCLDSGSEPGPQAFRRASGAARRNRERILLLAAKALGIKNLETIGDTASCPTAPHRGAVAAIDVTLNSLRRVEGASRSTWQYASGCVDGALAQGLMCSSNAAEGFVAFVSSEGLRVRLRNDARDCFPFSTPRLATTSELAQRAAVAHKAAAGGAAHPDAAFLKERFCWKSRKLGQTVDFEPPALWGSHEGEAFLAGCGRELGVAAFQAVRLQPELVCLAALQPGKLRVAAKHLQRPA